MKMLICRKKSDSLLTFEYSKKRKNSGEQVRKFRKDCGQMIRINEKNTVDNLISRAYNNNH